MGKRKFTAEQARDALLSEGYAMLHGIGPAGVAAVSLAEAINRSGVPRPSAYRVFGGTGVDPQTAFQHELVLRVVELQPSLDIGSLIEAVDPLVRQADQADASTTPESLETLFRQVCVTWSKTAIESMMGDVASGVHLSAMALLRTGPATPSLESALKADRARVEATYAAFQRDLMAAFGLRMRDGWSERDMVGMLYETTFGALLTAKAASDQLSAELAVATLAASLVAVTASATEADPRRIVSVRPTQMIGLPPSELSASA